MLWTFMSLGICLAAVGTARAQDSFLAVGAFVGEPSGFSIKYVGEESGFVLNGGWSSRRDKGFDLNAAVQFYVYESKRRDRLYTVWNLGAGGAASHFSITRSTPSSCLAR
jgi:hypothetical protein